MRKAYLLLAAILIHSLAHSQYKLPKSSILADSGVTTIDVLQTVIGYQSRLGKPINEHEITGDTANPIRFFIGPGGRCDSIYQYPNDTGYWKKEILAYDEQGNLISMALLDKDDNVMSRSRIDSLPLGEWKLTSWEREQLSLEAWFDADSIKYKSISYRSYKPDNILFVYTFDKKNNVRTDTWYNNGEITSQDIYTWQTKDGVPYGFVHEIFEKEGERRKNFRNKIELPINEEGVVVNKYNGRFDDPYIAYNFNKRYEKYRKFHNSQLNYFINDQWVRSFTHNQLWTFDGVEIIYHFSIVYETK